MTVRRPLVIISGTTQELPTGDTVDGAGSGGGAWVNMDGGNASSTPIIGSELDGGTA